MRTGSTGRQTLTVQRQKQTDGEKAGAVVAIDEGVLDSAPGTPAYHSRLQRLDIAAASCQASGP